MTKASAQGNCDEEPRGIAPFIDPNRCEGAGDCLRVCPYDVFELRSLTRDERERLGFLARFKVFVHGGKQAFVINGDACHACGLCVPACPERAIRLTKLAGGGAA